MLVVYQGEETYRLSDDIEAMSPQSAAALVMGKA